MFQLSDRSYVVLDDRCNRSMKPFLRDAVATGTSHRLYQLHLSERMASTHVGAAWHDGISVARLESLSQELHTGSINFALDCCQTSTAASVLATQTRRSDISGPALQSNHREVGRFLADRLLDEFPESLVQKADFAHVQGTTFQGNVTGGQHVLIVPLMRGGEPMSRGVHDRFPSASVFHFWNEQENLSDLSDLLLSKKRSAV